MNCKTFVFVLGLLLISSSGVYAQNKGKNLSKAVESAVTKKVPGNAGKLPTAPGRTPIAPGKLPNVAGKTGLAAGANVPGTSMGQRDVNVSAGTSTSIVRGADIAKKGPAPSRTGQTEGRRWSGRDSPSRPPCCRPRHSPARPRDRVPP